VLGHASPLHRSVNVASHRTGPGALRHAVRIEYRRVVRTARSRGTANLLRQAPAGSSLEPRDQRDRSCGALDARPIVRSWNARPMDEAPTAPSGVYGDLGGSVRWYERGSRGRRRSPRPVAAILAAGLPRWSALRLSLPSRCRLELLRPRIRLGV